MATPPPKTVFSDILARRARMGPTSEAYSRRWFRSAAQKTSITPSRMLTQDRARLKAVPMLGHMYLFQYDPKHKATLPYYDRYPLVFPFASNRTSGNASQGPGFLGLNMHYLPPVVRARLMDALWATVNNDKMDNTTRLRASYTVLKAASQFRWFSPCVKMYLFSHMRSKFFHVMPKEWDIALMLPLSRFQKQSPSRVHHDSWQQVRGKQGHGPRRRK